MPSRERRSNSHISYDFKCLHIYRLSYSRTCFLRKLSLLLRTENIKFSNEEVDYRRKLRMSDFWMRKIRSYFRKFDFDNDGVISQNDFEGMAESFCGLEKANPTQKEEVRQRFIDLFSYYTKAAGAKDDVLLTEDLLIESMKKHRDDPAFKKVVNDLTRSIFTVMDLNQDDFLQFEEFRRYFESVGVVDIGFTKEAFETIDSNHDGKLSFEEFTNAAIDYMWSDAENTSAMFGHLD